MFVREKIWTWYNFQLSVRLEADSHGRAIVSPPATLATSTEAIDLLKQMLQLFQNERITAEQALKHPLFSNWILYQHNLLQWEEMNYLKYCYDIPQMAYVIFKWSIKLKDCGQILLRFHITILKANWYKRISYSLILFFIVVEELQLFSASTIESNFEF